MLTGLTVRGGAGGDEDRGKYPPTMLSLHGARGIGVTGAMPGTWGYEGCPHA
jgi:hypothetical protein